MAVSAVKSEPAAAEAAPYAGGKKGIIKLAVIGLLVCAVAGGGAWWYLGRKGGDETKEAKHEPVKPPVFYPLEQFTVNLLLVDNPQFLQTGITLKVASEAVVEELKLHTPVVRDRILMLMSSRKAAELLTVEGKRQLGEDIVNSLNQIFGAGGGKPHGAAKTADAKDAADGKDAKDAKAAEEEEEDKAAEDEKDAKGKKTAKSGKAAEGDGRPVKEVLFTSFIIQ